MQSNYEIARKKLKRFEEESRYCGETTNDKTIGLEVESIHNSEDMFGMPNEIDNYDVSRIEHLINTPTNAGNILTHGHFSTVSNIVGMATNESVTNHHTNCLLQDILRQNKSTLKDSNTGIQEKFRNVFNNFPLRCLSDVVEMEEKLKGSASYHLMKTRLQQCGCSANLNDSVTSMLQTLFTDECATFYNFDGKNNLKNPFKESTIYNLITDVTLTFHKDGIEHDVKTRIRSWLRLASTRISNRELTKNKNSFNFIVIFELIIEHAISVNKKNAAYMD
ncbi:DUF4806 domain-containing protein [Aphis craccivora]|uniref:DUF4806 domain-containing protein n=1 Tax=Aphis craccivora TaxID=307492 RepID=A0A6G0YS96_APHCR|nr:DUF4806 domain-containing protein [Aphis craccivora]